MLNHYTAPDFSKSALLIVDVQNDFSLPGAVGEIPGTMTMIPNIKKLADFFRNEQRPIIHIVRIYSPDGSNVDLCRRELIEQGTGIIRPDSEGVQIVKELLPDPSIRLDTEKLLANEMQMIGAKESIVYKPRWGAFYKTNLEKKLRQAGINTLVFCGCNFPNCPRISIYQASERDFKIVFVEDGNSNVYERGISELRNIAVTVVNADSLISMMR